MDVDYLVDIRKIDAAFLEKMITRIVNYDFFMKGEDFYHKEIKKGNACETSFALVTRRAVYEFERNQDHGLSHSIDVYNRALDILNNARYQESLTVDVVEAGNILKWAAIFHDLSRFYGANKNHEYVSKRLAEDAFYPERDFIRPCIFLCIEKHDWFNVEIDGELEDRFKLNRTVDIFRLADKTSIGPVEEINRYYLTGKRYKTRFFDPHMDINTRFDFKNNFSQRDMITFFLIAFILNENSFFFDCTKKAYREWAVQKETAKRFIIERLCIDENVPQNQIDTIEKILKMV